MNEMRLVGLDLAIAIAVTAVLMFLLRLFPFAIFSKRKPPTIIHFIEKYIPAMAIAVLIVYCLKDTTFSASPWGIPTAVGVIATALLHLWKNNSMLSIFGGTILYMLLDYLL